MVITLRALRFGAIIATAIGLLAMMPREVAAKACECKDIGAMTAELHRVSTAEAAWKEIFAWARGLHQDTAEPSSNDELNTKYAQLARASRAEWDRIIREPVRQIERLEKAGELDENGEPMVNPDFAQAHCDDIVEGVRVHERAHRSFYLSPGNFIEGGLIGSRRFRLRSESEVVSYRTQGGFIKEKLDALKQRCKLKVTAKSEWHVPGPANLRIAAMIGQVEMKQDEQGQLTGSGTVNWVASADPVGDCRGTLAIGSSHADARGELDDKGQLMMNLTYQPAAAALNNICTNPEATVTGNMQFELTPDPLQLSVPAEGGTVTQSHVLEGLEGPTSGSVIIIVTTNEAVAFNPHWRDKAASDGNSHVGQSMKKASRKPTDELRPEYKRSDFVPNPSIERTGAGKPAPVVHVARWAASEPLRGSESEN